MRSGLFGTSGIRGVVGQDITPGLCHDVGRSLASLLPAGARVAVAADTRPTGKGLKEAAVLGLTTSGASVTDWGILPTPALALLTKDLGFAAGVMVTASHNPPEYNGMKLFDGNGMARSGQQEKEIEDLYKQRLFRQTLPGRVTGRSGGPEAYYRLLSRRLPTFSPSWRVVVDPGNGAMAGFLSGLLRRLGLEVLPINDEPDGLFPGRSPEPSEESLGGTVDFLRQQRADIAVCFDGDGDRVAFCDSRGFLDFNGIMAFLSYLVLKDRPGGTIVTTVETGRTLDTALQPLGARVVRGQVGDGPVAHLCRKLGAALGAEPVGVYILPEMGYYPDGIYAFLLLLSRLRTMEDVRAFIDGQPRLFMRKAKVPCPNEDKEWVARRLGEQVPLPGVQEVNSLDGVRLELDDAWVLLRPSGTEPVIRVTAEARSVERAEALVGAGVQYVKSLLSLGVGA